MDQESALVAGYWNALTAEYTATLPGSDRTWTREETESDPDLSDEDYWTLLSALAQARNAAAGPYLLELSSLRREIARSSGYDSVLDYYYETYYGRDYGREESEALFSYVKEHIVPVYSAYAAYYAAVCAGEEALNRYDGQGQAGKLAAVGPVIGQIAPELGELFDYMVESNLCDIERSDTKLDVGFTISLPSYRSAFLFDSPQGGYYDISTLIHEFGHFSAYCAAPSVNFSYDTAETHSQGLEALSLRYADQLFGEAGDAFRGADLYALLHAVVDGCLYGEFQVEFFDMEDPTLQDVNRLFRTLAQEYGYVYATDSDEAYDWVEVNHTFESPFYYISYATSALSALDLFLASQDDYQGAVDTYLNLIRLSDESGYRETMARAGFPDVFQEETVSGVGGELSGYLYTDLYGLYDLEDHWALPEIGALVSAGLIGGTGDGFQPSAPVSRAALCTILYRAEGQPQPDAESSFSDVAADAWYADAAAWAAESGITTGTGGGFSPDVPLTRESLALLLYRYAGEPSHSGGLPSFSDADTVSPWASQEMCIRDRDIALPHLGVPGVGGLEDVVKAAEQGGIGFKYPVVEHAEELFRQRTLLHAVVEVEPRLCAPADVEGGVDMTAGPLHDLTQLVPILHLGEVQVFHRRAGDDHAVVFPPPDLIEGGVKGLQVVLVDVLGTITGSPEQLYLDLEGRVGQLAQDLCLGDDLGGHQVEDEHLQGPDILVQSPVFGHDEDILPFQGGAGGEGVGNFDGHGVDYLR